MSYTFDQLREHYKRAELELSILDCFMNNGYVFVLEEIDQTEGSQIVGYYICRYKEGEDVDTIAEMVPDKDYTFLATEEEARKAFAEMKDEELRVPDHVKNRIRAVIGELTYLREHYEQKSGGYMSVAEEQTWSRNIAILEQLSK